MRELASEKVILRGESKGGPSDPGKLLMSIHFDLYLRSVTFENRYCC